MWATSSTNWLQFVFCLQQVYRHVLNLNNHKCYGACEVYRVEPGFVLFCTARDSTVCFTLDGLLSGPWSFLDTKGEEIVASHQGMTLYIGWTVRHICSLSEDKELISQQAERYIPVAIRPNSINVAHAVNFRPNTMKAWFDPEAMHVRFWEDKWHWHRLPAEHSELNSKCFLNILKIKIDSVNFYNFRSSFK
jgi:hypothetical protein